MHNVGKQNTFTRAWKTNINTDLKIYVYETCQNGFVS